MDNVFKFIEEEKELMLTSNGKHVESIKYLNVPRKEDKNFKRFLTELERDIQKMKVKNKISTYRKYKDGVYFK